MYLWRDPCPRAGIVCGAPHGMPVVHDHDLSVHVDLLGRHPVAALPLQGARTQAMGRPSHSELPWLLGHGCCVMAAMQYRDLRCITPPGYPHSHPQGTPILTPRVFPFPPPCQCARPCPAMPLCALGTASVSPLPSTEKLRRQTTEMYSSMSRPSSSATS